MSIHVMSWVLKQSPESVSGRRLVLLVLADHANDEGRNACPSVETIAHETKLTDRSSQRALRALEIAGAISSVGLHPRYRTTIYELAMDGSARDSAPWSDEAIRKGGDATSPRRDAHLGGTPTSPEPSKGNPSSSSEEGGEPSSPQPRDESFSMVVQDPAPDPEPLFNAPTQGDKDVTEVWAYFVERNNPVRTEMSPSQKTMIQRALREISVEEAKLAIDGNRASAWHRERGKHALSDIFKPNRSRGETIREKIDRYIQDAQRAGKGPILSVDRGMVQRHKTRVLEGASEGTGEQVRQLAEVSREWLENNGWSVELNDDGWPRFTEKTA